MAGTATAEENARQEEVTSYLTPRESSSVNYSSVYSISMANKATAAFVLAIIGATYQTISLYVAVLVDHNTYLYNYGYGYETLFFSSFFVFWSASHLLEDWKGQIKWPSIILGLGAANLSTIILGYYAQNSPPQIASTLPSILPILALIPGPLLMIIGGILGFSAVRRYSREHGHAVLGHA